MGVDIRGLPQLRKRLFAVQKAPKPILARVQLDAVKAAKDLVPRKTGNLSRSISRGSLTPTFAIVKATANYAGYVELGTRPHEIRPNRAKVLAWASSPSGRRLSGTPRRGAAMTFARLVHHPGTKPQPFLVPGAQKALADNGWHNVIYDAWNSAA